MPLYVLYQLECDHCHLTVMVKAPIDLQLRKAQGARLEVIPTESMDSFGRNPAYLDAQEWHIRAGYPDIILCPACKPVPEASPR